MDFYRLSCEVILRDKKRADYNITNLDAQRHCPLVLPLTLIAAEKVTHMDAIEQFILFTQPG